MAPTHNLPAAFRWRYWVLGLVALLQAMTLTAQQDTKVFSGVGRAPVESGAFGQDRKKEEARARAERLALPKAMEEALKHVLAGKVLPDAKMAAIVQGLVDQSPILVRSRQVAEEYFEDGHALVKLAVKVDLKALQGHLNQQGVSTAEDMAQRFKVWVLSYTVEGSDPPSDRSERIVLRDEVRDERQNIQAGSHSELKVSAAARSQSASIQASRSSSDQGSAAAQSSSSLDASRRSSASGSASSDIHAQGERGSFSGSRSAQVSAESEASLQARRNASSSANWNRQDSAALDARSASASASYSKDARSGSTYSDTSTKYFRVTEYADPTKKDAGRSNEVRSMFEGVLRGGGFEVATMNLKLMDQSFNEDTFLDHVLGRAESAGAGPDDYLALVLNSLTPISGTPDRRKFGSRVIYRVVRVKDRTALVPANAIARESESLPTDDAARTQATRLALATVESQLPAQVRDGYRRLGAQEASRSEKLAGKYLIRVENLQDRSILVPFKQSLRSAGFTIKSDTSNAGQTEEITVTLGTRSAEEVKDLLDALPRGLQVLDRNDREARVKAN